MTTITRPTPTAVDKNWAPVFSAIILAVALTVAAVVAFTLFDSSDTAVTNGPSAPLTEADHSRVPSHILQLEQRYGATVAPSVPAHVEQLEAQFGETARSDALPQHVRDLLARGVR